MEAFLKNVSLGWLLRNIFGGVFLILSFRFAVFGTTGLLPGENAKFLEVEIPIALFAGVTIYALHRACVYPFVEAYLDSDRGRRHRLLYPLIGERTVRTLYRAWGTGVAVEKRHERYMERLTGWADPTQFLYVASLSILLGHIGGVIHRTPSPDCNLCLFGRFLAAMLTATAFFLAALTSDWRLKRVRDRMPREVGSAALCELAPEEHPPPADSVTPRPIP